MSTLSALRLERQVDALLAPWSARSGPGVTVGVVRDGALALHRSAGLASLELGVPIGPDTVFRIASVTKQFTCAAILLLEAEGRLGLDDAATAHLPGLPELGVTIRHLLHNTSGWRDMLEIMRAGGIDLGTPITAEQVMAGVCRQRTLNFAPNTRFLYSNTNFLLLGRIVERITGGTLEAFLRARIWSPAGMTRTHLPPGTGQVIPGLATGYFPAGPGWTRAPHAFPLGGEGGMASCVEDLALWSAWLDGPGAALAAKLSQQAPFTDGAPNFYARGQVVRTHRGVRTVGHGGLWPGYRTEFLRVPALDTTVIVISNDAESDPASLAHDVLDLLLDATPDAAPRLAAPGAADGAMLAGRWVDEGQTATIDIAREGARLMVRRNGVGGPADVLADGRIGIQRGITELAIRPLDRDTIEVEQDAGVTGRWHRAVHGPLPPGLEGSWHSPEMAALWTIAGNQLSVAGPVAASAGPWTIEPVEGSLVRVLVPGVLFTTWWDLRIEGDALVGHAGRVKGVRFERCR